MRLADVRDIAPIALEALAILPDRISDFGSRSVGGEQESRLSDRVQGCTYMRF